MSQALIGALRVTLGLDSAQFEDGASAAERRMKGFGESMGGLARKLAVLGAGLGAAIGVRALGQAADIWSDLSSQVGVAVGNMEAAPETMRRIADVADASYSSVSATAEAFARNNRVLSDMGYGVEQTLRFTEALNNALVATATRGQRAQQVQDALSKAMATGRLEASGLETILTHGGAVAEALASNLGVTTSELYRLRSEGKITGQVIADSLISNFDKLRAQAESMPATFADARQIISNAFLQILGTFDKANNLSGSLAAGFVAAGKAIRDNADNIVSALQLIATTAATAATVFATRWAVAVGVTFVSAARVAVVQALALERALGATSARAALAGVAIKGLTGALALLRRGIVALGFPALIIGMGLAVDKFLDLQRATGSFGGALKALGDFVKVWADGVVLSIEGTANRIEARWLRLTSIFRGDDAMARADALMAQGLGKQRQAISNLTEAWGKLNSLTKPSGPVVSGLAATAKTIDVAGASSAKAAKAVRDLADEYRRLEEVLFPDYGAMREYRANLTLINEASAAGIKMAESIWMLRSAALGKYLDDLGIGQMKPQIDAASDALEEFQKRASQDMDSIAAASLAAVQDMNAPFKRAAEFGKQITENLAQGIVYGHSIGDALVNSFKAAAAEMIASGLFKMLFGAGIKGDSGALGGLFAGFFAKGGTIPRGQFGIVGERGPELAFAGSRPLNITPNSALGGGPVIHVDARGSTDPGLVLAAARRGVEEGYARAMDGMRRSQRTRLAGSVG